MEFKDVFLDNTKMSKKIKKKDYLISGKFPIIDQSKKMIAGYSNDKNLLYEGNLPVILFGDHTNIFKYIDFPFILGADGVKVLENKTKADTKYLYYYLQSKRLIKAGYSRHFKYLKKNTFNLHGENYQNNIVASFEELNSLKKIIIKQKILFKKLKQSLFFKTFGNPTDKSIFPHEYLRKMGTLNRGKSKHRPRNDKVLFGGEYPFIQTGDVRKCFGYIKNYSQTYNKLGLKQSKLWPKDTLCITIAANIAETGILEFEACFPDSIVGFLANEETNVIYIQEYFELMKLIMSEKTPQSAQKNMNLTMLKKIKIPFPKKKIQDDFAKKIIQITKNYEEKNLILQKINLLEKSLFYKMFNL